MYTLHIDIVKSEDERFNYETEKYERTTSEDNWFRITSDVEEEIEERVVEITEKVLEDLVEIAGCPAIGGYEYADTFIITKDKKRKFNKRIKALKKLVETL